MNLCAANKVIYIAQALEVIWRNQNPPDCSKAKYMITEPFLQGVGSEMHVYGVGLGMAIETGRVFLQQGGWSWRFKNAHCASQNKYNMECYYMPLSKCTLEDAMATMKTIHPDYAQPEPNAATVKQRRELKGVERKGRSMPPIRASKSNTTSTTKARIGRSRPQHKLPSNTSNTAPKPYMPPPIPRSTSNKKSDSASGSGASHQQHQHGMWTPRADADLEAAVIKHGVQGQWQKIADSMSTHNKTDIDCLFRFRNALRKKLNTRKGPVSAHI